MIEDGMVLMIGRYFRDKADDDRKESSDTDNLADHVHGSIPERRYSRRRWYWPDHRECLPEQLQDHHQAEFCEVPGLPRKFSPTVAEMADISPTCSIMVAMAIGAITRMAVTSNLQNCNRRKTYQHAAAATDVKFKIAEPSGFVIPNAFINHVLPHRKSQHPSESG